MSTHSVKVVRIPKVEPVPETEALGVVQVEGLQVVVRRQDWAEGQLAVFVPADYVCPERAEFAFLKERRRIKPRRMCGRWSEGLLVPAPEGVSEGDELFEAWGFARYEPPVAGCESAGDSVSAPEFLKRVPKYDVEGWHKVGHLFSPGETVHVTEKVHGTNARYCFHDGRMWAGSRGLWKSEGLYTRPLEDGRIEAWCRANPDHILYGEIYGWVQDLRYGHTPGKVSFCAFDALSPAGLFVGPVQFHEEMKRAGIQTATQLYVGPLDDDKILPLVVGKSTLGDCIREGIVIRTESHRYDPDWGRVIAKRVSNAYLERS